MHDIRGGWRQLVIESRLRHLNSRILIVIHLLLVKEVLSPLTELRQYLNIDRRHGPPYHERLIREWLTSLPLLEDS